LAIKIFKFDILSFEYEPDEFLSDRIKYLSLERDYEYNENNRMKKEKKRWCGFIHFCIPPTGKQSLFIYSNHDEHTHPYRYEYAVIERRYWRMTFIGYVQIITIEKPSNLVSSG
jgi:hypothetical protein